jgi:hypothetical protein
MGCQDWYDDLQPFYDENLTLEPVTFQPLARPKIQSVRRTSITSALLILVMATSGSACVVGWGSQPDTYAARQACAGKKSGTATAKQPVCRPLLKSPPGKCGVRSFVQFQFVALHRFAISAPLQRAVSSISPPLALVILASSIGSPETDRGPPCS